MAEFLTTYGISANIEKIITGAKAELFLISPYLQIPPILSERLKEADLRKVKITLVYGKEELESSQKEFLSELNNLALHFCQNLYAKCYFNENLMVVTSMNLHQFSEKNNREMGILVSRTEDAELFEQAHREASSILGLSQKVSLEKQRQKYQPVHESRSQVYAVGNNGFCIRCGRRIDLDPDRPYCRECYDVWADFGDPDYEEEHCHVCGKPSDTTMNKPLCRSCYKALTR